MSTYHIHIGGLVQGVGFRPFVCRVAKEMHIAGWVNNGNDGVHIECNAGEEEIAQFYHRLLETPPTGAFITQQRIHVTGPKSFRSFGIAPSEEGASPDLLLAPDKAICPRCRQEMGDPDNRRYHYAFTTCLQCGPRYSIVKALPYDRIRTTMAPLLVCGECKEEYLDINNRRHHSQTNSCRDCAIHMRLYALPAAIIPSATVSEQQMPSIIAQGLKRGDIYAVKGIGGYLLLCDATNEIAVRKLRDRKHRPHKPFALLYTDLEMAAADVCLRTTEREALTGAVAPIVLCRSAAQPGNGIAKEAIAPGLDELGVMLPYTPLLLLISQAFGKPLVATSANVSGSPILYKDEEALDALSGVADYLLAYDREIVVPQDDSVLKFSRNGQRILLRRSRGLAPAYFPNPFTTAASPVLAMGADLKSAFAIQNGHNLYVSQYLGNQESLDAQDSFTLTLHHLLHLLKAEPGVILVDSHPGYFVSQSGMAMAESMGARLLSVQHHKAHFAAVLAENHLCNDTRPVLGFIWDGTGYGEDGQVWGGEVFIFENKEMQRIAHLDYFPQLLGDKMSREPRLSALSLLQHFPEGLDRIQKYFSAPEWQHYRHLLQQAPPSPLQPSPLPHPSHHLLTSSMGRFLDGIAAILGVALYNTYEGEAAMKLEALARTAPREENHSSSAAGASYDMPLHNGCILWQPLLASLLDDLRKNVPVNVIAIKAFRSLARLVTALSDHFRIGHLAFSGGIFQNALLTDMILEESSRDRQLYFHRQLSPNDECIGFGQIAWFNLYNSK